MSDIISLYPDQLEDDNRPLPERIASYYNFRMQYDDDGDLRRYRVSHWIAGIMQHTNVRKIWDGLKFNYPFLHSRCKLVKVHIGQNRLGDVPFADAEILYEILVRLPAKVGYRDEIIDTLVKAGVKLDEMLHDPEQAEEFFANLAERNEYNKLRAEGRTHEDAIQWLDVRRSEKVETNLIKDEWHRRDVTTGSDFGRLNNDISKVATGQTATALKKKLKIKGTPRDFDSSANNVKIAIACMTARTLHVQRNSQGVDELSEDIHQVEPIIKASSPEIDKLYSQQPRRLPKDKGRLPDGA